jgi:hypothetical protein
VGALTAVLCTVLERLVSLEVQLVKFLISKSRHVNDTREETEE